jgi:hypothetical protein
LDWERFRNRKKREDKGGKLNTTKRKKEMKLGPGSVDHFLIKMILAQLINLEDDHNDSPPYLLSRRGIGFLAEQRADSIDLLDKKDDHLDSPPFPLSRRGMGSWLSNVLTPLIFLIKKR